MTHQRRASDLRWDRRALHWLRVKFAPLIRENWYRDVVLIVVCAMLFFGWRGQQNVIDDIKVVQQEQREGRRAAVDVVCAATSAVIDAGRATIIGGAEDLDPEFARNLERLGYPPRDVRRDQAQQAAQAYAAAIAKKVEDATGVTGIVRRNGTLDCVRLAELSKVSGG